MLESEFVCLAISSCLQSFSNCSEWKRLSNRSNASFCSERERRIARTKSISSLSMVDGTHSAVSSSTSFRRIKQFSRELTEQCVHLARSPSDVSTIELFFTPTLPSPPALVNSSLSSSSCNRGLAVLRVNGSLVGFCLPKRNIPFYTDLLSVVLHLDLFLSLDTVESDPRIVRKLLPHFL